MTKERAERLRQAAIKAIDRYDEVRKHALEMADRLEKQGGFSSEMERALLLLEETKQKKSVYLQAMKNYKSALSQLGIDWESTIKEDQDGNR